MMSWLFYGSEWFANAPILFRSAAAFLVALLLVLLVGPFAIRWLKRKFHEPNVCDSGEIETLHRHKDGTPTMGGLFVLAAVLLAVFCFGDFSSPLLLPAGLLIVGLAVLGFCDDWMKTRTRRGMRAATKLLVQFAIAGPVAVLLYRNLAEVPGGLEFSLPLADSSVTLGVAFVPMATLVIVLMSNAVNLTDGLDGLAAGSLSFAWAAVGVMAIVVSDAVLSQHYQTLHVPFGADLVVVAAAMVGALLGFLRFNRQPARVFMGDTGSLPLGGALGFAAVALRQEWLFLVIAAVFLVEAGSVLLQVASYKLSGRRIFRCAPLHHHFELLGWSERKIVSRFWFVAAASMVFGAMGLLLGGNRDRQAQESDESQPSAVAVHQDSLEELRNFSAR